MTPRVDHGRVVPRASTLTGNTVLRLLAWPAACAGCASSALATLALSSSLLRLRGERPVRVFAQW